MDEDEWTCKNPKAVDTTHLIKGKKASDIQKNPDKYVLHLDYFRFKNLLDINPPRDSVYVRAQCEPFDDEMKLSEQRMINWLRRFGINENNNFKPYQIHASGHASGKELQEFIDNIKPRKLIPIHTEKPELFSNKTGEVIKPALGITIST
jgi:ribonuclease J